MGWGGRGIITFIATSGMACCKKKKEQSPNRSVPHLFGCFRALDHRIALPYLMNDRKSTTVVSYHAAMKYGVKIVEKNEIITSGFRIFGFRV